MRTLSTVAVVVGLALLASGCPKKKDKDGDEANKNATPPASTTKPGPSAAKPAPAKTAQSKPGLEEGKSLLAQGKLLGNKLLGKGKDLSEASVDEVRGVGKKIADESKSNAAAAARRANTLLNSLARDPDSKLTTGERLARMLVLMVPIVGPTKRFIDARKLYEAGKKDNNEKRMQEARREALLAFVEGGLDIGTLGLVGSKIDLIATGFDKVIAIASASRKVSALVGSDLKVFDQFLDKLLAYDEVRAAIDGALSTSP